MLGRKKDQSQPQASPVQEAHGSHAARPGAKNRPTPKRRDQEAARKHLVVDPGRTPATARTASREEARERQQAMLRGEEWALMDRDRGMVRRYVRDYVDARFSLGELLMPLVFVSLLLSFLMSATKNDLLFYPIFVTTYGIFFAAIIDAVLTWRRIRRKLAQDHPRETIPSGTGFYAGMRMMQIRRTRAPRPQVARGQYPA